MPSTPYLLQIVTGDGATLRFHAGETVELNLRDAIKAAILKRGVRFRTEAHVALDIEAGIEEALEAFKATATPWRVSDQ